MEEYSERNGVQRVIPEAELLKIVSSLPQLLSLNEDLYNDLKSRVDHWADNPKIADVIIKKVVPSVTLFQPRRTIAVFNYFFLFASGTIFETIYNIY